MKMEEDGIDNICYNSTYHENLHTLLQTKTNLHLQAVYSALQSTILNNIDTNNSNDEDDNTSYKDLTATELFLGVITALEGTLRKNAITGQLELLQLLEVSLASSSSFTVSSSSVALTGHVKYEIIHDKMSLLSRVIRALLTQHCTDTNTNKINTPTALIKSLITCSSTILCTYYTLTKNSNTNTAALKLLQSTLLDVSCMTSSYTALHSPKYRKCAMVGVTTVLSTSHDSNNSGGICGYVCEYLCTLLEGNGNGNGGEDKRRMFVLNLLHICMPYLPVNMVSSRLTPRLLQLLFQSNNTNSMDIIRTNIFTALHNYIISDVTTCNDDVITKILATLLSNANEMLVQSKQQAQKNHANSASMAASYIHLIVTSLEALATNRNGNYDVGNNAISIVQKLHVAAVRVFLQALSLNTADVISDLRRLYSIPYVSYDVTLLKVLLTSSSYKPMYPQILPVLGSVCGHIYDVNKNDSNEKTDVIKHIILPLIQLLHHSKNSSSNNGNNDVIASAAEMALKNYVNHTGVVHMLTSLDVTSDEKNLVMVPILKKYQGCTNDPVTGLNVYLTKVAPLVEDVSISNDIRLSLYHLLLPLLKCDDDDVITKNGEWYDELMPLLKYQSNYVEVTTTLLTMLCPISHHSNNINDDDGISKFAASVIPNFLKLSNKSDSTKSSSAARAAVINHLARYLTRNKCDAITKKALTKLATCTNQYLTQPDVYADDVSMIHWLNTLLALLSSQNVSDNVSILTYRAIVPLLRTNLVHKVTNVAYKIVLYLTEHQKDHGVLPPADVIEIFLLHYGNKLVRMQLLRTLLLHTSCDTCTSSNINALLSEVPNLVPEVLLCHKESSKATRDVSYEVLECLYVYYSIHSSTSSISANSNNSLEEFSRMILAALSAKTTSLQSAAVLALCRLMYVSQRNQWCHSAQQLISMHTNANASTVMITYTPMYLIQCLRTILLLMTSSAREVLQAVIGYVRVAILAIPTSALTEFGLVKDIIVALNAHTNSLALRYRNKIKIIIRVLLRKIGVQEMTNVLHELNDDSSKNKNYGRLMTHVMKLARREARKKANQQHADDTNDMEFDELMEGEEDDSLMGRTLLSGMDMTHRTKLTRYPSNVSKIDHDTIASRTMNNTLSSSRKKMRSSVNQQQILLVEKNDGIADNFDMLNEEKMQRMVRFVDDDKRRGYMDDDSDDDGGALEFDADGRLLIPNDDDFSVDNDVNNYGDDDHAMNDNATYKSSKSMKSNASSRSKKGKQLENHTNSNKRMSKLEQTRQRMQEQHQKKNASNNNNKQSKKSQLGAAYKSSKAGGDVKRKNQKYEPYAFVPLDGRTYTKKHRAGAVQQMEGVVRQRKGSVKRKRS